MNKYPLIFLFLRITNTKDYYLRGQEQSVGNEKNSSTYSNGWITTPRCYAKGKFAAWTYHRYTCGTVIEDAQFDAK